MIHPDFWKNAWRVVAALWHVKIEPQLDRLEPRVRQAWEWYALWVRRLVRLALVVIVGQPLAVVFVSLSGVHEFTAFVALTPILALVVLSAIFIWLRSQNEVAVALPAGIGALAWDRTGRILKDIGRGLSLFLFLDLIFGLYFSLVPVENDRKLVLWIVLVMTGLILARAGLTAGRTRQWTTVLLTGFLIVLTFILLNGGWEATKNDYRERTEAKAAPVEVQAAENIWRVTLAGPDEWVSTGVNLNQFPAGLHYYFYGPNGTKVRFVDEKGGVLAEGLITDDFGVQGGIPEFAGPTGTATLQLQGSD